ncbi:hypothetical protein FD46_GL000366 [Liquorilactobacillus oeni DSM 19972]|uniref:Uncharacterized protein n=1 Tax=Liquorilactobacillus oeni DSM 19972 TaxID=1423777 RepID=A0A0R1MC92_9LACO|nr:hypothetical protein FD46_GL000366 [Liquorilactobacillus oeni DSM 19972]
MFIALFTLLIFSVTLLANFGKRGFLIKSSIAVKNFLDFLVGYKSGTISKYSNPSIPFVTAIIIGVVFAGASRIVIKYFRTKVE